MATLSSSLAWEIPWTEEPGGLQSTGLQGVGHNLATKQQQQITCMMGIPWQFSGLHTFTAMGPGSIPGWGTKHSQKGKKKKNCAYEFFQYFGCANEADFILPFSLYIWNINTNSIVNVYYYISDCDQCFIFWGIIERQQCIYSSIWNND